MYLFSVYRRNCKQNGCTGVLQFDGQEKCLVHFRHICVTYEVLRQFMLHFLMGRYICTQSDIHSSMTEPLSLEQPCSLSIASLKSYTKMLEMFHSTQHLHTIISACHGMHTLTYSTLIPPTDFVAKCVEAPQISSLWMPLHFLFGEHWIRGVMCSNLMIQSPEPRGKEDKLLVAAP